MDKVRGQTAPELLAKGESLLRKARNRAGRIKARGVPAPRPNSQKPSSCWRTAFLRSTNNYPKPGISELSELTRSEKRLRALSHALCHYASIGPRIDQAETKSIGATAPQGSPGSSTRQAKQSHQCWRRIAEHDYGGVYYVTLYNYPAAENRLRLLQTYRIWTGGLFFWARLCAKLSRKRSSPNSTKSSWPSTKEARAEPFRSRSL